MTDVTDHFAPIIHCSGKIDKRIQIQFSYRDYNNVNKDNVCQAMMAVTNNLQLSNNPDMAYNAVADAITRKRSSKDSEN